MLREALPDAQFATLILAALIVAAGLYLGRHKVRWERVYLALWLLASVTPLTAVVVWKALRARLRRKRESRDFRLWDAELARAGVDTGRIVSNHREGI